MNNHTPGPWHWQGDSLTHRQFDIYAPGSAPQQHVCTVNNLSVDKLRQRDAAQAEANARLIAAAPDLLDALRECISAMLSMRDQIEQMAGMFYDDDSAIAQACKDHNDADTCASAAIAKATGEA